MENYALYVELGMLAPNTNMGISPTGHIVESAIKKKKQLIGRVEKKGLKNTEIR